MNKFLWILVLLAMNSTFSFGDLWQDHWIKGVEYCEQQLYPEAEEQFRIAAFENDAPTYVLIDLGKVCMWNEKKEEALVWLNKALADQNLDLLDTLRGLNARFLAHYDLGMKEEAANDMDALRELNPSAPKFEISNGRMIIRNVPETPLFKELINKMYPAVGVCKSKDDIRFITGGVCIINLSAPCEQSECSCCGNEDEEAIASPIAPPAPPLLPSPGKPIPTPAPTPNKPKPEESKKKKIANCKLMCKELAMTGYAFCGKRFQNLFCIVLCQHAVDGIQDVCNGCCVEGTFYKTCLEPYQNILDCMDASRCDPCFD